MASTPLGDIPGARFHMPAVVAHASVASGGAAARLGQLGPFDHNIRVRSVYWSPTGAAQNSAAATASYRSLTLYNGGTAGTVSATGSRIASLNLIASVPSLAATALTVSTGVTVASGGILYFSQDSAGAANNEATVLAAGQFAISYEVI